LVQIFLTQLAIKAPLKSPPQPMCASTLPRENGTHEIGVDISKKTSKGIPDVIDCNLKKDEPDFNSFWYKYSRQLTRNHRSSSHLTEWTSVSALPEKKQRKRNMLWNEQKRQ